MSEPENLTDKDREMIDAVVEGHYEVYGSAVKGNLHGSLYAAGKMSRQTEIAQARGLLLLALYHHQGGSSEVGQPIRRFLGIGEYDHLTPEQIADAKKSAALVGR